MAGEEPKNAQDDCAADAHRAARRQMIKSTVAAFPVVLTITAGTARASNSVASDIPYPPDLQGGSLDGGSEEFDVQKYLDEVTNMESADPFILDPGGLDPSQQESIIDRPIGPTSISDGPIGPNDF